MAIWFTLFKKELRLGWMAFMIFLILQLLLMGLGIFLNMRFGDHSNAAPMIIGMMLTICLLFYVPVYLLFNAIQERKTFHLWMQNPLPAWSMLLAKLAGALVYFIVTTAVVGGYTWASIALAQSKNLPPQLSLFRVAVLAALVLLWCGIGGGVTFLFLWTARRTMRSRIGKWSWLVLIVGIGIYSYVDNKLTQSGIFDFLTNWGHIPDASLIRFVFPQKAGLDGGTSGLFSDFSLGSDTLYLGSIVFDLLITLIVFLITSWLTDHELEAS
ncbi:MAG: hypothetical protein ABF629_07120 [Sporolactobacillus sp.]|uniref:hypothetical protein n=1 Tax=Sporolactobacillus sp. STSJ-5 TaxID=2965076 RepID=UPI002105A4F0|nr:hypothetical protein [Sporolactobacillus sp. STSJ-5]MCQ2009821.1 hypothetical protein [Sporolactobacillus sp. STSJ-5]